MQHGPTDSPKSEHNTEGGKGEVNQILEMGPIIK